MRDAARAEKRDFIFRKPEYSADDLARFEAEGRTPVVRLQAPGHDVHFVDQVLGEITVPEAKMDDTTNSIENVVYARDPKVFDTKSGMVN